MTTRRSIALILSPFGLLLISAGRLIIVANFNTTTAVTIASSGGFVNTLLGTVIPLVPLFMPYFALLLLLSRHFFLSVIAFVFVAFISPTSISLPQVYAYARTQWQHLASLLTDFRTITIVIVLAILAALWAYNRSFAEALSVVFALAAGMALLFAVHVAHLSRPLRLASKQEHHIVARASSGAYGFSWVQILLILVLLAVVFVFFMGQDLFDGALDRFSWLVGGIVALVATIALFPYVNNIYPVPRVHEYYAEAAHAMWLPVEKIQLSTQRNYYGYVLSSSSKWVTVLLAHHRTIVYLSADEVVRRSVCQLRTPAQPKPRRPLIPLLYHHPARLPHCAKQDETTSLTSFLSKGESLREISESAHRCPWTLISVTNAHAHEELPPALRGYESVHNWYAPTPAGQRFWYYPRTRPDHRTCEPSHLSW